MVTKCFECKLTRVTLQVLVAKQNDSSHPIVAGFILFVSKYPTVTSLDFTH